MSTPASRYHRRHPPTEDDRCRTCGADPLDPIHWPPVGWREHLLARLGLLR